MRHSSICSVHKRLLFLCVLTVVSAALSIVSFAQGSNNTGNGGKHIIQGKLFLPNGQRLGLTNIQVRLESLSGGDLTVFADNNGAFIFRNLTAGSYYIVIRDIEAFKDVREAAYLDDPGGSSVGLGLPIASTPKVINVPVYLELKRTDDFELPPGVINAELSNVPSEAAELFKKAGKAAGAGNNEKAIAELVKAIGIYPEFPSAYNELGRLYGVIGQRPKSIDAFRAAVRLSPRSADPRLNLGCALAEMKNNEEAAQHLNEAIKQNAASVRAFYCMGKAQMQMQNLQHAEKALNRAITLSGGNHGKSHYILGGIYWSEKQYLKAADELEKYLKLEPNAKDADQTRKTIAELRSKQN